MTDKLQRALTALQTGKLHDADKLLKSFLLANPRHVGALNIYSAVLTQLGQFEDAERYIRLAIRENATSDATFYNYGIILKSLRRPDEALDQFNKALALNPRVADTWNNRGTVLNDLARHDEAIADFDRAISLNANHAGAYCNKGKSFALLKSYDDAIAAYDKAIALQPNFAEAWLGRGNALTDKRQYRDASAAYDRALALNPDLKFAAGARLYVKLHLCEWANLDDEIRQLTGATRQRKLPSTPFILLATVPSPADQLAGAKRYVEDLPFFPPIWRGEAYEHERIRVAYVSHDLNDHPVAQQTVGLFEDHDRSRFEITAISFGPQSESELSRRTRSSFDRFIDIRSHNDQQVAELMRNLEIDIAVDLGGFTQGTRPNILARRPAPIQVNYLGYPGTMGAAHIDYIIADPVTVPRNHLDFFSEKVVWLPETLMVNDAKRPVSDRTPPREECGLPVSAFVFCCFNNTYKLLPAVFDIWMKLLKAVEGSVLWLAQPDPAAAGNLRKAAEEAGVSPDRLIFAQRLPATADHVARLRQADLFLDTWPYNGHVTVSDALWAGIPVLTRLGSAFAGRVAASQLKAIGLSDLVADTPEDYEARALALARDPSRVAAYKRRLAAREGTAPLFDTARTARHIEAAYTSMHDRHRRKQPPQGFAVDPIQRN